MDFMIFGFRANVFPHAPVVVGIVELSAVDRPLSATVAHSRVVVLETVNKLVVVSSSSCVLQNS